MKTLKNLPQLTLLNLLRRRKTTLSQLLTEFGISTYDGLCTWCRRLGVIPPSNDEFLKAFPQTTSINNPMEGMIVLEPIKIIEEQSGCEVVEEQSESTLIEPEPTQKRPSRRKKETTFNE